MKSNGTRKKSPSQIVTGVSRPASPKVQPRPFSSPILRALYLGEAALVVAAHLSQILNDLQPIFHLWRQGVVRVLLERVVDHRERGRIWRVVVEVVVQLRTDLGVENVVYELVGVVGVLRALRYRHVVRPAGRPRLGNDVVEIRVPGEGVVRIPGEVVSEQKVALQDQRPVLRIRVKVAAHERFLLLERSFGLVQLVGVGGVYGVTETVEGCPHRLPGIVEHAYLALELRVPHGVPAVYLPYLLFVVEDASGPPLVRYAVLVVWVVGEAPVVFPNVLEVGNLRLVERQEDVALDHDLDHVVRGHDYVVAGAPRL